MTTPTEAPPPRRETPSESTALPTHISVNALRKLAPMDPQIELHSLDMGYYLVRVHHAGQVALLVDDTGAPWRFTGTSWASRTLAPLGFRHAILTWAEVTDEMVGQTAAPSSPDQLLAHGTRVALNTRD